MPDGEPIIHVIQRPEQDASELAQRGWGMLLKSESYISLTGAAIPLSLISLMSYYWAEGIKEKQ